MAKFKLQIDVEPKDIPALDDAHKHDCADALIKTINSVFKYTLIFSMSAAGFYGAYSIFGFWWVLRMQAMLPQISPIIPAAALLILAVEFISGTMKRPALILQVILHIVLLAASLTSLMSLIAVPFAFYGIIRHITLLTLVPLYEAISSLKGYPDFMPPLSRDMVNTETVKKEDGEKVSEEASAETDAEDETSEKENVDKNSQTGSK